MVLSLKQQSGSEKLMTVFLCLLPVLVFMSKVSADAVLSLTGLIFLYFSLRARTLDWLGWPWVRAMALFIVFAMATAVFSPYPEKALTQALIYVRWPLAAVALIVAVFNSPDRLRLFEKAALCFLAFIVADGIVQMVTGVDVLGHPSVEDHTRMTGPFAKRVLGVYGFKLFFFAFAALLLMLERSKKNIIFLSVLIVLFNVFLLLTGERIVFLLCGLFFAIWLAAVAWSNQSIKKHLATLLLSSVAIFAVVVALNHQLFVRRFMPFVDAMRNFSDTTYGDIFHSAFQLWQLSPLVGVGTRMYNEVCVLKLGYPQDESLYRTVEGLCQRHPHNIYLELLAQNGLFGLLIFLAALFFIFRQLLARSLWQKDMLLASVLFSSVFVIFWPLASSMSIFANNYAGAVWLTIAWALARARQLPTQNPAGGQA